MPYNKNSPETIQEMFGSIAKNYDRTNAVLSFQMHRIWNASLIRMMRQHGDPDTLLDLCCGTGEIGFGLFKQSLGTRKLILLDFCKEMLEYASLKAAHLNFDQQRISYLQADAQSIPLPDSSVQSVTVAYGIRNIKDPAKCVADVFRVLQPGGTFGILELTQPQNALLRSGHQLYLRHVLPLIGRWLTSNEGAYQYLCQSIHGFIKPLELENILNASGFRHTAIKPLTGGIATIIYARKPFERSPACLPS